MTEPTIVPVILSGGVGTRLWPLSRTKHPKQLTALLGERTMLQETAARVEGMARLGKPLVICNAAHHGLVAEQMAEIGFGDAAIVLEPAGRNTAPAVAVAALAAAAEGADPVLLVLPADHVIRDRGAFRDAVEVGARLAAGGELVTFGIVPDRPHTGYGYVQRGAPIAGSLAYRVGRFVEKPDAATAADYLVGGEHFWNSGMFMFSASVYLAELDRFAPGMVAGARAALDGGVDRDGALLLDESAFTATPADSIDYAVMEHTERAVVIPLDAGWSDVGAWRSLWEIAERDEAGNATTGDVLLEAVTGSYVRGDGRLIAVVGVDDVVVVDTPDALLVCHRDRAQEVKAIVERLAGRPETERFPGE